MRAWLSPIALLSAALCGCATSSQPTARVLAGQYTMVKGGFNEALNVQFAADGSYVLEHELFSCVIGPNGELPLTFAKEEGTWALDGKVVVLQPRARTKDFPEEAVFTPAFARRLLAKRDGFSSLLVSADYPDRLVLKKTNKPLHLIEPSTATTAKKSDAGS